MSNTKVPSLPDPEGFGRISELLRWSCTQYGERPAVSDGLKTVTYAELWREIGAAGESLSQSRLRGTVLFTPHTKLQSLIFIYAALEAGLVPLIGDQSWKSGELQRIIRRCQSLNFAWDTAQQFDFVDDTTVVAFDDVGVGAVRPELLVGLPKPLPPEASFGRFTSGSTGLPRCLLYSERAALAMARRWQKCTETAANDRVLCVATLNNGLAFNTSLLPVFLAGAQLHLYSGSVMPMAIIRVIDRIRPTIVTGFPAMYQFIVERERGHELPPGVRLYLSSAAPLSIDVKRRWSTQTGTRIADFYGMAEVGICTTGIAKNERSMGPTLPEVDLRIVDGLGNQVKEGDSGRIIVRTPSMAIDFIDDEAPRLSQSVDAEGFFATKDRGHLCDGELIVEGRIDEIINLGGRKVAPEEVAAVIRELDGVRNVVVRGEMREGYPILAAYIESELLERNDIVQHCTSRLSIYMVPQKITIQRQLPRTSVGKLSIKDGDLPDATSESG
jgi:long-chain acyl-CoA synthetase